MDLRVFYQKVREIQRTIATPFAVVVSEATADGGKAGVLSEVSREAAARLVVEKRARLATGSELAEFARAARTATRDAVLDPAIAEEPEPRSSGKRNRSEKE